MAIAFYHGHGSPFSWPVWLCLEHKGAPYELRLLSFAAGDTRKPEFVAINPRHHVPTIVDDGFTLWESAAIIEYLDERFPDGPSLFPGDARARARVRRLLREAESYLYREGVDVLVDEYFWKGDEAPEAGKVAKARERVREELEYFARELAGDFLCGAAPTAADYQLYTYVAYCRRITARKPEAALVELIPPALAAWAGRIEALPFYDKTFPPHWR